VIVGSAIVKLIAQYGRDSVPVVKEYVKTMKQSIRESICTDACQDTWIE